MTSVDVSFLKELLMSLAKWMDSIIKDMLVPLLVSIGISESTANTTVTVIELLILVTLIAKLSGMVRWILIVVLALLLLGAFLPMIS